MNYAGLKPKNPYDFVPLEEHCHRGFSPAGFLPLVSKGRLSGYIKCELFTETPLYIGSGEEAGWSSLQYIPATSIKGMIRSVAETVSSSCLSTLGGEHLDFVPEEFHPCRNLADLCMCCALFGMVPAQATGKELEEAAGLAGRVMFSDALHADNDLKMSELELPARYSKKKKKVMVVLGKPQPKHVSFYFAGHGKKRRILGRKFYFHHDDYAQTLSDYRAAYEEMLKSNCRTVKINAISEHQEFSFNVDFISLQESELGVLLYALALEEGMRHHLGFAKPYGLGCVKVSIQEIALTAENSYLDYGSGEESRRKLEDSEWRSWCQEAWRRNGESSTTESREKLQEILKWPQEGRFRYPRLDDFFKKDGANKISLGEYQEGVRPEGN